MNEALDTLAGGAVEMLGVLPYASNYTYLTRVRRRDAELLAVYKPRRGERPLWDFPPGTLARREVATYLASAAAGWDLVPPTVLRDDAPLGDGSLQLFIEHDPDRHYLALMDQRLADFADFAAFDVVVNNADRKAGHVIEDESGHLWGVDHGLTFHVEPKLRTVIWEFAGEPLPESIATKVEALARALTDRGGLGGEIASLLTPAEAGSALARAEELLERGRFPSPSGHHPLPWPLI